MAAYTSPTRVERNGYLVAFAGETMTETEARKRGLLGSASDAEGNAEETGAPNDDGNKEAKPLDKKQIMAELESRDIKYNKRAKIDDLRALLDEAIKAEAEDAAGSDEQGEDGNEGDAEGNAEETGAPNDDGNEGEAE